MGKKKKKKNGKIPNVELLRSLGGGNPRTDARPITSDCPTLPQILLIISFNKQSHKIYLEIFHELYHPNELSQADKCPVSPFLLQSMAHREIPGTSAGVLLEFKQRLPTMALEDLDGFLANLCWQQIPFHMYRLK